MLNFYIWFDPWINVYLIEMIKNPKRYQLIYTVQLFRK